MYERSGKLGIVSNMSDLATPTTEARLPVPESAFVAGEGRLIARGELRLQNIDINGTKPLSKEGVFQ
jgi:hypothetical protein